MNQKLEQEIQWFTSSLEGDFPLQVSKLAEFAYRLKPNDPSCQHDSLKPVGLTLMAVTHGNELAGIGVLNRLIRVLGREGFRLPFTLDLILANVAGSRQGKRFVERDLNRSFGADSRETLEARRAKELEPILRETRYLIDFHQTIEPSMRPFFIFPYSPPGFEFARYLDKDIPIVTHWGDGFSQDGSCSDEYVNKHGGVGISIELGQKGFDLYQECLGLQIALNSLELVETYLRKQPQGLLQDNAEIYTWAEVIPYPQGDAGLDEGWKNFQKVEAGQRIGFENGAELKVSKSGPLLFPKYPDPSGQRPKEICRVLKQVDVSDLGR